jgi:hypothetical protein
MFRLYIHEIFNKKQVVLRLYVIILFDTETRNGDDLP